MIDTNAINNLNSGESYSVGKLSVIRFQTGYGCTADNDMIIIDNPSGVIEWLEVMLSEILHCYQLKFDRIVDSRSFVAYGKQLNQPSMGCFTGNQQVYICFFHCFIDLSGLTIKFSDSSIARGMLTDMNKNGISYEFKYTTEYRYH